MTESRADHSGIPEVLLVGLAQRGDRKAFAELVNQRQGWIRNLMRRCSGDVVLAEDLAQQVFLQAWKTIRSLQRPSRFGAWLKRMAINTWLQHARKNDPTRHAEDIEDIVHARQDPVGIALDLDRALATLPHDVRFCIVLSYHEGMTHSEIAEFTQLPPGTIKSHIRRGTARLKILLAAYSDEERIEEAQ